ncbi:hypothetical protein CCZ01_02225 [Helicobacter monodelphidis]|uniref:hypothetical protein n=1 Tax=Helicobacter sp. 15-1451 TaxID=2004995 RepID=UPI000DCB3EA4|nr:hypothetical protein [Helicobacter sp. 15-1451]RAX58624.1 hypothetical protein CCZ01_02225 [Helicobacter sp. 15-1451]
MKSLVKLVIPATLLLSGCSWFGFEGDQPPASDITHQESNLTTQVPSMQLPSMPPPKTQEPNPPRSSNHAVGFTRTDRPLRINYDSYIGYIPTLISIDYGMTQNNYNRFAPVVESYARMSVDVFNRDFPSLLGEKRMQIVSYYPQYPISVDEANRLPAVFYSRVYITVKEFQGTTLSYTPEEIAAIEAANAPQPLQPPKQPQPQNVQSQQQQPKKPNPKNAEMEKIAQNEATKGADPALDSAQKLNHSQAGRGSGNYSQNLRDTQGQNLPQQGQGTPQQQQGQNTQPQPNPLRGIALPPKTPNAITISMRGEILLIEPGSGEVLWSANSLWREFTVDVAQGQWQQAIQAYIYNHSIGLRDELLQHLIRASAVNLNGFVDDIRLMKGLPRTPNTPLW